MKFNKKSTTVPEQIKLLSERGMIISDKHEAAHFLQFVSYYRLSGYFFHFQKRDDPENKERFEDGVSFEKIKSIYIFDRELRWRRKSFSVKSFSMGD